MSLTDAINDAMKGPGMPRYALVRGAADAQELERRLPFGFSIDATLRHRDGGLAWIVLGIDLGGGSDGFDLLARRGLTVQVLDFMHPLLAKVRAARPEVEDDEEDEDDADPGSD